MQEEIWLPVSTFEHYEVSNLGGVRHADLRPVRRLSRTSPSTYLDASGQTIVRLYHDNCNSRAYEYPIKQLVQSAFQDVDIQTI